MKKIFFFLLVIWAIQPTFAEKKPRNVIFMIGDGMGLAQIYSAMVANGNKLNLERCTYTGFSKTYSADHFVTDSGAGATALACGVKTRNGMIGMTPDSLPAVSVLEEAEKNKLATGIVVACAVTHATPAGFVAHQPNRNMYEEVAADYLKTDIDVLIGGGRKYFNDRADGRNLIAELEAKSYRVVESMTEAGKVKSGKLAAFLCDDQNPKMPERGPMLPDATQLATEILSKHKEGFFLMVEGSQIDWAAHDNDLPQLIKEVLDFDNAVGKALDFAEKDGNTLVIITADHETGGLSLLNGKFGSPDLKVSFADKYHSGVPVPVFAFGPGAENFTGMMENIDFKPKLEKLLRFKK